MQNAMTVRMTMGIEYPSPLVCAVCVLDSLASSPAASYEMEEGLILNGTQTVDIRDDDVLDVWCVDKKNENKYLDSRSRLSGVCGQALLQAPRS